MKIFWTRKQLENYLAADRAIDRAKFTEAAAHNAAKEAVHYYLCWRTLDWWRQQIDEAEKAGEKYVRLADLVSVMEVENAKPKRRRK